MAKKCDNCFIPRYIPSDLSWCEKDGLDTWYLQNKCNDFLRDTENEIMGYPHKLREEICSSIFCNVKRDGMYVKKETIDEHFKGVGKTNGTGRG